MYILKYSNCSVNVILGIVLCELILSTFCLALLVHMHSHTSMEFGNFFHYTVLTSSGCHNCSGRPRLESVAHSNNQHHLCQRLHQMAWAAFGIAVLAVLGCINLVPSVVVCLPKAI